MERKEKPKRILESMFFQNVLKADALCMLLVKCSLKHFKVNLTVSLGILFFFFNQEGMKKPQCFVLIHFLIIYYFNMAVLILCNHLVNMKTMNILKSYFSPNSNFKCRNRTK